MLNKSILMGRLTRDPELRHTQSNTAVASFTLAVARDRKNANGTIQTDFIDCVAWGRTAEFVKQCFSKGMLAIVVGRIKSRNWNDKNRNKRTTMEINVDEVQFGETKKASDEARQSNYKRDDYSVNQYDTGNTYSQPSAPSELDDDEDLPF